MTEWKRLDFRVRVICLVQFRYASFHLDAKLLLHCHFRPIPFATSFNFFLLGWVWKQNVESHMICQFSVIWMECYATLKVLLTRAKMKAVLFMSAVVTKASTHLLLCVWQSDSHD